jgi:hypothetical protein
MHNILSPLAAKSILNVTQLFKCLFVDTLVSSDVSLFTDVPVDEALLRVAFQKLQIQWVRGLLAGSMLTH